MVIVIRGRDTRDHEEADGPHHAAASSISHPWTPPALQGPPSRPALGSRRSPSLRTRRPEAAGLALLADRSRPRRLRAALPGTPGRAVPVTRPALELSATVSPQPGARQSAPGPSRDETVGGCRETCGYRWRSRSAGRKPGGPRPTGSCPKALGAGPRRRPADFANGIHVNGLSLWAHHAIQSWSGT